MTSAMPPRASARTPARSLRRSARNWSPSQLWVPHFTTTCSWYFLSSSGFSAARAVRCAEAIIGQLRPIGLEIRAGVHTGEIELMDGGVGGIAVHIGARVAGQAGPSEILVSGTVRDLVAGSGIDFVDRGTHQLKGVPGEWRLFSVRSG